MVSIATWNVNSIRRRLPNVLEWLTAAKPDIALLQELKCEAEAFPRLEIEELGYNLAIVGQKSWNGVALLSKRPIEDVLEVLPDNPEDRQARYVEATVGDLRVASLYLPNGNPAGGEKYAYKLAWMDRLRAHAARLLESEQPFVLGGDFNVIPAEADCYNPDAWSDDALFLTDSRRQFRAILHLGLIDAFRALHPAETGAYTFWDYQGRAWAANNGIRIDHILLSPQATDRLIRCDIDKGPRGRPEASDHTPVVCELEET
jgi:exodeoxyribonuclease-3